MRARPVRARKSWHSTEAPRSNALPAPLAPPPRRSICVLAGDISPIDVIVHVPVLCEGHDVPYIYVPSKEARARGP